MPFSAQFRVKRKSDSKPVCTEQRNKGQLNHCSFCNFLGRLEKNKIKKLAHLCQSQCFIFVKKTAASLYNSLLTWFFFFFFFLFTKRNLLCLIHRIRTGPCVPTPWQLLCLGDPGPPNLGYNRKILKQIP